MNLSNSKCALCLNHKHSIESKVFDGRKLVERQRHKRAIDHFIYRMPRNYVKTTKKKEKKEREIY